MTEKKLIEELLLSLENHKEPYYVKIWFKVLFWLFIVFCFYGFNWMLANNVSKYIVLIAPCIVGFFIGYVAFLQESEKLWPVVKKTP